MTQSQDDNKNLIARLAAAGAVIQTIESPIPYPLPGAKLGLGNITTLAALGGGVSGKRVLNFYDCLVMVVSRVLTSSFLVGNFLSPGFVISVIASPLSFIAMYLAGRLGVFSIIGVSIVGAVVHNLSQLFVVYVFFARGLSLFSGALPSILIAAGVVSGSVTGFIVSKLPHPATHSPVEEFSQYSLEKESNDCPSGICYSVYGWRHLLGAFALIFAVVLVRNMKVLLVFDVLLWFVYCVGAGFSVKKFVKVYSRFAPFGIAMFALPLLVGGWMTPAGFAPFLRVLGIFQITAILFSRDKNYTGSSSHSYRQLLPSLSSASGIFRFFPLRFVARVWDVTNLALAVAPSMRDDLLNDVEKSDKSNSLPSDKEGFYRRVVRMISF